MEAKTRSCFPYLENGRHKNGDSCEDEDCQPGQPLLPAGGGTCVTRSSGLSQAPTAPACTPGTAVPRLPRGPCRGFFIFAGGGSAWGRHTAAPLRFGERHAATEPHQALLRAHPGGIGGFPLDTRAAPKLGRGASSADCCGYLPVPWRRSHRQEGHGSHPERGCCGG